jgi:hypothetical protein
LLVKTMRTSSANEPVVVSTDGTAGPYVTVTPEQLQPVLQALHDHEVPVQVEEDAVLFGGIPALSVINLGPGVDVNQVQGILNGVAAESRAWQKQGWIVQGEPREVEELARRIEAGPPGGWSRRLDIEDRFKQTRVRAAMAYCLTKAIAPTLREVAVWLESRRPGELYVSSVLPLQGRDALGIEQYNQALDDFRETFLGPLVRELKVRVLPYMRPAEPTLQEILSPDAIRRLRAFSAGANRGDLRSLDVYRWNTFIARTHLDDAVVDPQLLSGWLADDGWPEEQRTRLVSEYRSGRGLLSVYDEEQVADEDHRRGRG